MITAFIALGANLGDAAAALKQAVILIHRLPLTQVRQVSSFYLTAPLDTDAGREALAPGAEYPNAVAEVRTGLGALELLSHLQRIETDAGRQRTYRNAPRQLDLDLLLFGDEHMQTERMTLPHPRMLQRAFVLVPLAEIAPDKVTAAQLAAVAHQPIELQGELGDVASRRAPLRVKDFD
jgi:2-amino-4-hydroxy-6-hydroxymethyldihydropteridine diphosphokinase